MEATAGGNWRNVDLVVVERVSCGPSAPHPSCHSIHPSHTPSPHPFPTPIPHTHPHTHPPFPTANRPIPTPPSPPLCTNIPPPAVCAACPGAPPLRLPTGAVAAADHQRARALGGHRQRPTAGEAGEGACGGCLGGGE